MVTDASLCWGQAHPAGRLDEFGHVHRHLINLRAQAERGAALTLQTAPAMCGSDIWQQRQVRVGSRGTTV